MNIIVVDRVNGNNCTWVFLASSVAIYSTMTTEFYNDKYTLHEAMTET